jgi:hypothetical protein
LPELVTAALNSAVPPLAVSTIAPEATVVIPLNVSVPESMAVPLNIAVPPLAVGMRAHEIRRVSAALLRSATSAAGQTRDIHNVRAMSDCGSGTV